MTERANKDKLKRTLSLSKSKKRSSIKDGASTSSAPKTTPITSFFSSQPPPKLACPLCGQFVPRFKINEHIDLQCPNFERNEGFSISASNNLSSVQLSPRENTPRSPKLCQKKDEDNVHEQTSPYFKKNSFTKTSLETTNKSVVRVLDLGSLSAKLSRKGQKTPEATQKVSTHPLEPQEKELYSETLNSSQKENLLQRYEDPKDCERVARITSAEASTAPQIQSGSETGHSLRHNAPGSEEKSGLVPPNKNSFSTLVKRKVTSSSKMTGFRKKAKYDRVSKTEEKTCPERPRDTAEQKQPKTKDPLCSVSDIDAEKVSDDSLQASGAESNPADQDVKVSPPTRLPYYLQNFCSVLKAVLENEDDRALFDHHDMSHIQAFEKLSGMLKYRSLLVSLGGKSKQDFVFVRFLLQSNGTEAVRETLSEETEVAPSHQTGLCRNMQ